MNRFQTIVPHDLATTKQRFAEALSHHGFGILSEIDVKATLAAKLGVEHEEHRILGVCKPTLAKQALDFDRDIALLLPCTATLRSVEGGTEVAIIDPETVFALASEAAREHLAEVAIDARASLKAALDELS